MNKINRRIFCGFIAAPLIGCGGGDADDDDAAPPAAAMRRRLTRPIRFMEWGDSSVACDRLPNGSSPSYEAGLKLAQWGLDYDTRHEGVGGMPAINLLTGKHPLHVGVAFPDYPSLAWCDIGGIRSGINELRTGQSQAEFGDTLQTLVDHFRAARKIAILETPTAMDPAIIRPAMVEFVAASAATVREVFRANRDVAVMCDHHAYAINQGIVTWKLDGMHGNEDAVRLEGRLLARAIVRANDLRLGVTA